MMSENNIFFSIIIPNFNQASHLKKALNGVIKQTYKNYEIIIIDNNSTDKSRAVINSFNDVRIKSFYINNMGIISKSRNLGLAKASGEWICFLDADDYWFKNKLEEIKTVINKAKNIEVICNGEVYLYENLKKFTKKLYKKKNKTLSMFSSLLLNGNQLSTSATTVKKSFIKQNNIFFSEDKKIYTSEDYDFWLRLAFSKARFEFIDKYLGIYLIHKNSSSNTFMDHYNTNLYVALNHLDKSKYQNKLKKKLKEYLIFRHKLFLIVNTIKKRKFIIFLRMFYQIIKKFYLVNLFFKIKKK